MSRTLFPKTSYLIWHTPRTGSNTLCNILSQAGLGNLDYVRCNLFIGYGSDLDKHPKQLKQYIKNQTQNQVFGCKIGIPYIEHLQKNDRQDIVDTLLNGISHHLWLSRNDVVRQAVSMVFASATKRHHSESKHVRDIVPPYDPIQISRLIDDYISQQKRIAKLLATRNIKPLCLSYETYLKNVPDTISCVVDFLGLEPTQFKYKVAPRYKKLDNEIKEAYYQRYIDEYGQS